MEKIKEYRTLILFHIIVNVLIVIFITGSSYYHIPLSGFKDTFLYIVHLCLLQCTVAGIVYIMSLHRVVFKVVFSFFYILYGLIAYWKYTLDISVSSSLIDVTFQSKAYIIKDLISFPFMAYFLLMLVSLFGIFRFYKRIKNRNGILLFFPISIIFISLFFVVEKKRLNTFKSRLPYRLYYSFQEYFDQPKQKLTNESFYTAKTNVNNLKVVFILGESVRADHLGINGYYRNTTPFLSKIDNLISYRDLYTNKTYTAASIPQILTNRSIYDSIFSSAKSIYGILNTAGIQTSWIGNQLLEVDYRELVLKNNEVEIIDELKSEYSFHKRKDKEILPFLSKSLKEKDSLNLFITLHMFGSHWWYEDRYENKQRIYKPVIDSKHIPSLKKEQLINSYDNTILYLDEFLNEVIKELEEEKNPTIMIYVSDHGESLGENDKWLHAQNDIALTNPAFLVWFSEKFRNENPDKACFLNDLKSHKLTTDIIYYLILDMFEIEVTDISSGKYARH